VAADTPGPAVALLGFAETGKSTYLAAFFLACEAGIDDLMLTTCVGGDREYLHELATKLSRFQELKRTSQTETQQLDLQVSLGADKESLRVFVPDLSGEHLRESMNERELASDLEVLLEGTDTILLFVRADDVSPVVDLAEIAKWVAAAGETPSGETTRSDGEDPEWVIELSPTQPRLLDVVQELIEIVGSPVRIGLMLSAWDKRDGDLAPMPWAEANIPIVVQALSNAGIDWEIFGISGQGGDFDSDTDRDRLEGIALAERATVHRADGTEAGIGEPLRWALRK
jgi:hypothetical protein